MKAEASSVETYADTLNQYRLISVNFVFQLEDTVQESIERRDVSISVRWSGQQVLREGLMPKNYGSLCGVIKSDAHHGHPHGFLIVLNDSRLSVTRKTDSFHRSRPHHARMNRNNRLLSWGRRGVYGSGHGCHAPDFLSTRQSQPAGGVQHLITPSQQQGAVCCVAAVVPIEQRMEAETVPAGRCPPEYGRKLTSNQEAWRQNHTFTPFRLVGIIHHYGNSHRSSGSCPRGDCWSGLKQVFAMIQQVLGHSRTNVFPVVMASARWWLKSSSPGRSTDSQERERCLPLSAISSDMLIWAPESNRVI